MSIETKILAYGSGTLESWEAVQRAKKKYPGVTRFTVDHTGPRPVARPAYVSPVDREQERLARRLQEIAAQQHRSMGSRLATIKSQVRARP